MQERENRREGNPDTETEREEHAIERRGRKVFILTDLERSAQSDERERENGTRDRSESSSSSGVRGACDACGVHIKGLRFLYTMQIANHP